MAYMEQAFNQFLSARMEYIANSILSNCNEYRQLIEECNQLFLTLMTDLPQEYKEMLQNYDTSTALLQGIAETLMYKQGLKDGISLNRFLTDR
ncbi:hypothetical protein [Paenibacillus durus]|uniref:Uncharacterized protein n=1 Tax=Paenibacillus durus ATCC 35681 TaxID=1333534 RepID=A0A0F7F7S4_PAEDU|nr:hypothetical protein [Paenibacillus durus]AKG33627.1 hypothetical protein VK70_02675 [Paenibacillus durus ATCC 35681]